MFFIASVGAALLLAWFGSALTQFTAVTEERFNPIVLVFVTLFFFGWFPRALLFFCTYILLVTRISNVTFPEVIVLYAALSVFLRFLLDHVTTHRTIWAFVLLVVVATLLHWGVQSFGASMIFDITGVLWQLTLHVFVAILLFRFRHFLSYAKT